MRETRTETRVVEQTLELRILVCDWCRAEREVGDAFYEYPKGWRRLELFPPDESVGACDIRPETTADLCPDCSVSALKRLKERCR